LVQVGEQATADRYTYIPLIGLFLAIAWLAPALIPRTKRRWRKSESDAAANGTKEIVLAGTAVAVVLALTVAARVQAGYWRDSIALFSHALAVTTDNEVAHNNLGLALADDGRTKEAAQQYQEALKVSPTDPDANYNFGLALAGQRRYEQAAEHYRISLKSRPNSPKALDSLGTALAMLGHPDRAIDCYRKSLELDSDNARAHNNLANALFKQGQLDESVLEYRAALRLKPDLKEAHSNLSIALFYKGDYAGAWREAHLARKYGASPRPGFLNALSWKMPEPAGD